MKIIINKKGLPQIDLNIGSLKDNKIGAIVVVAVCAMVVISNVKG